MNLFPWTPDENVDAGGRQMQSLYSFDGEDLGKPGGSAASFLWTASVVSESATAFFCGVQVPSVEVVPAI